MSSHPDTTSLWTLARGDTPLLINVPHAGTELPAELRAQLSPAAQPLPDTDWHVEKLFAPAVALGATVMAATQSRYLIDLNRDPEGRPLYPEADNTELCPLRTFANEPIHAPGAVPTPAQQRERLATYWQPYHAQLAAELARIRARHGHVVLLDAHSIRAEEPRFFAGRLPDLNVGTVDGQSCSAELEAAAVVTLNAQRRFTTVLNGRFKGGYITRHYGRPQDGVQALQLEIVQAAYMDEAPPYAWDAAGAAPLTDLLQRLVETLIETPPPR